MNLVKLFLAAASLLGDSTATLNQNEECRLAAVYGWVNETCGGGYTIDCAGMGLKDVPASFPRYANSSKPCLLDLSENKISHIQNHSFISILEIKLLFLFKNSITKIDADAFIGLTQLLFLNLTENRLQNPDSFGEGVFSPFVGKHLKYVSLKNNEMKPGEDLQNLFRHIKSLDYLDISYNENLTFQGMRDVLNGLANSTIITINFNHIHEFYEMGTKLKLDDIRPIKDIRNLTRLYLDLNKIEVVEEEIFDLLASYKTLTVIAVGGNRLTYGKYTKQLYKMKYVQNLYLSRQHSNLDPFYRHHFEDTKAVLADSLLLQEGIAAVVDIYPRDGIGIELNCTSCRKQCPLGSLCLCIPPNLQTVQWRKSFIELSVGKVEICAPSKLIDLDVSFNLITEWNGPIKGLGQLQTLNLAENYCQASSPIFFDSMYSLRSLNLSYNFLGQVFSNSTIKRNDFFRNLTKLELLDLSENRITLLPKNIFEHLRSLKYLNVSRNMLSVWDITLQANCLKELDVSGNKLETLPKPLRMYLDKTAKLGASETCNRTGPITVALSGNPLRCNCDNRPFLKWLVESAVDADYDKNVMCHLESGQNLELKDRHAVSRVLQQLDKECFPCISIIVSLCMFVVGVLLCITVYRSRWKLRHWYYKKRQRHNNVGYERLFERDAFISYASSESRFIKRFLVPALEEQRGIKVWVADRDSIPGASVAESLAHAIGSCRKTILILSRKYFKESWCDYEMNLARMEAIETHRKLMIIVLFEDIPAKDIPLEYQRLLKAEESLEYPSDPQYNDTFWEALSSSILKE